MLVALGLSLLSFSLLPALDVGSPFAIAGAGVALVAWGAVVFALVPVQQHHLISVAPDEQNGVLSLNSSAVYVGQGLGAGLGSLTLGQLSLEALGYAGALLAALTLIVLLLAGRLPRDRAVADGPVVTAVKVARGGDLGDRNYRVRPHAAGERARAQPCS
jgi:MFS transporter, DHA1 family, inner membrane transport protein